ncbi:MAG: neutral/alkaline non-lysosomal ceramidase N-terminal domain-containing protein [Bacteroidota bacterium]
MILATLLSASNLKHSLLAIFLCWFFSPFTAQAQLQAGTAKIDITGPTGSTMYGYGSRGKNLSTGTHDPLYARALVLQNGESKLAIVTLDLGAFYERNKKRVLAALPTDVKFDQVLLIASHSHSTPTNYDDFPSEADPWIKQVEKKIAQAIVEASQSMQAASIGAGKGEVREGFNRRIVKANGDVFMLWRNIERLPTGPLDYELGVISIKGEEGPIATLVNFTCHPVVLGPDNLEYSADYPGAMARYVSGQIGGEVMYLPGAQGDINPFEDKQPVAEGGFEQVERLGTVIGQEVVRVSKRILDFERNPVLKVRQEKIPLSKREDIWREEVAFQAEINSVMLGDQIAFATFPGEFFVEHGQSLKSRSPIPYTFFVGYTNDALFYFPTIQSTTEGGYGAAARTQVEVGAGERLVNRALINLLYMAGKISP